MMTLERGRMVNIKVESVRSSRQEMVLKLDFTGSEEFKNKEISIKNQKLIVLIENMVENYKAGKPLPSSDVITKNSAELVFYAEYPIEAQGVDIFIQKDESQDAATTMKVTSNIIKPVTLVLMIVAMPAAITLEKVLQSLDYLNYLNVEDLPRNVRMILEFTSQGSLFGNLDVFGGFYKFDDGDDTSEEETLLGTRRILSADTSICRTHTILNKEGLSCKGWNNTGLYLIQLTLLGLLMGILKILGNWARREERK